MPTRKNSVKSVIEGVTTYYVGRHYQKEVDGSDTMEKKYYAAAGMTVAMRTIVNGSSDTLNWLLSDHLGSTSITASENGTLYSEQRYSAFGEVRFSSETETPTDYQYTGQLNQVSEIGLYYYVARWYDPYQN